jgi:hypothetical protein
MNNNTNKISYSDDFEILLKDEAEKAEAMSLLHNKAYHRFNKFSVAVNIPVIILSSFVGFLSPLNMFQNQAIMLGCLSIFIAIIKTTDNYFDFTKRCETHRMTALNYIKISKWIQIQLSLERDCRVIASDLFTIINNDLQNIRDAEPAIPKETILDFNRQYGDEPTCKPAITNGLTKVHINKKTIDNPKTDIPINIIVSEVKK